MWTSIDSVEICIFVDLVEDELTEAVFRRFDSFILEVRHLSELYGVCVAFLAGLLELTAHVSSRADPCGLGELLILPALQETSGKRLHFHYLL